MITVTPRGIAWTALCLFLAGLGALAGYCAASSRVTSREGVGVGVLLVAAAVPTAWLRSNKLHPPGRHRS